MDIPGGYERPRNPNWGEKIDQRWWTDAASLVLRRFINPGAGEGPDQSLVTSLCQGLQLAFDIENTDDLGEVTVRRFLKSPEDTDTAILKDLFAENMFTRCAPVISNRSKYDRYSMFAEKKKKATMVLAQPSHGPVRTSSPRRPIPKGAKPGEDYWQTPIRRANSAFDAESIQRNGIFDTFRLALEGESRAKFIADPAVQVNEERWRAYFSVAQIIAAGARGNSGMEDDNYHEPTGSTSLKSNWLIGQLVHARWQFDYMMSRPANAILAEYLFSGGATESGIAPVRGDLKDYREIEVDENNPTWLGASQYAFGKYRPDLIDFTSQSVFEIKPIRGADLGILQLWRYSHNFNCARYFDELTKSGAQGKARYSLQPNPVPEGVFGPVDVTAYISTYLKDMPKAKYRPGWADFAPLVNSGEKIIAYPVIIKSIPGLILYSLHRGSDTKEKIIEELGEAIKTGVKIVAIIVVIAATSYALLAAGGVAAATMANIGVGATAAAEAAAESLVVVEVFGEGFAITEFDAALTSITAGLARIAPVL